MAGGTAKDFDWNGFEQTAQLQAQNTELLLRLDERERELTQLRIIAEAAAGGEADVRDKKILELSKKNRNVQLELEREKAKSAKLKADLATGGGGAEKPRGPAADHVSQAEAAMRSVVEEAAEQAEASAKEAAEWREKHSVALGKLVEEQHKAASFKAERDRMARALQREVGDDTPLSKLMENNSDWRGRAQQISLLKDKIRDLKARLGDAADNTQGSRIDARNRKNVEKIESGRKKDERSLAEDLEAARAGGAQLRGKFDASQARIRVLESEMKGLKEKMRIVVEKTDNDDRLIAALRGELSASSGREKAAQHAVRGAVPAGEAEAMRSEREGLLARCEELATQVGRQEKIILALRGQLGGG